MTDPANEPAALPIVGGVVTVGGSADTVNISSFTSSATPSLKAGQSVDLSLSASTAGGSPVSYKFYYCANYGTADYSNTPWTTVQEYSNSSSCRYTFPNAGNYIVVARAVTNPSNEPAALPIFGGVITVNPQSDAASAFAGNYNLNIYTDPKLSDGLVLSTNPTTLTVTDTSSNSIGVQLSSATNESFNANLSISGDIAQISSKQNLSNTSTLWDCILLSNGNNMALAYNTFSGHFPEGNMSIQVANWVKNSLSVNADSFVGTWKGSFYTNTNISGYNNKLEYTNTIDTVTITKISNEFINLGFTSNGLNESIQLKVADGRATLQSPVAGNDLAWQACSITTDGSGLSIYLFGSELYNDKDISLIMGLAKKQ